MEQRESIQEEIMDQRLFKKDYLVAILAGGLFILIDYLLLTFVPPYMIQAGYGDFLAGFQNTLFSLFCIFFRFYMAPMADTKGRRRTMLIGAGFYMVGCLFFLTVFGGFMMILAARMMMAVGKAAYLSTASCYISDIIPDSKKGLGIGIQRSMYSLALMVGPAGAIQMIQSPLGYKGFFVSLVITAVLIFGLVTLLKDVSIPQSEKKRKTPKQSAIEYRDFLMSRQVRNIYSLLLGVCISLGACLSFVAIYFNRNGLAGKTGFYFSLFAIFGLMGNVFGGMLSDRYSPKAISVILAFCSGLGTLLLYFASIQPLVIVITAAALGGAGNASTASVHWLVAITPPHKKGLALGLMENFIDAGIAAGAFLFGALSTILVYSNTFIILGALVMLISIWIAVPKKDKGRTICRIG